MWWTRFKIGGTMISFAWTSYSIASQLAPLPPTTEGGTKSWIGVLIGFLVFSAFVLWGWGSAYWRLSELGKVSQALKKMGQRGKDTLIRLKPALIRGLNVDSVPESEIEIIGQLYIDGVIKQEQRRTISPSFPYDQGYWILTDFGKRVVKKGKL